jgi:hypothetical protein
MTVISGVMPTPPPMRTMLSASRPVKVNEPNGAATSRRSPSFTRSCRWPDTTPCSTRLTVTST